MDAIEILKLENLHKVRDGLFADQVDEHLRTAAMDVAARSSDKTARKVTIEVVIKPETEDGGHGLHAAVQFKTKCSVPVNKTAAVDMGVRGNGALVFRPGSSENVNQMTMDEAVDPETGEVVTEGGES